MSDITQELETNQVVEDCISEYGLYVIEDRALADVRDGLKPAQRRILWAFYSLKRLSNAIPIKCATVVGEVIGKYHPHGDSACYDTLVNMAWMRYPLVAREGNFGSRSSLIDAGYAAQRYTETRLKPFADRIFDDMAIVPLRKSFTEEHEEPPILVPRVPLLLLNGCSGVAVGMSTTIPPHNLKEVVEATLYRLENPECSTSDLLGYIKGPDYGSGTLLTKKKDLLALYETGEGKAAFSCDYTFEDAQRGVRRLVITGFAPGFKKAKFLEETKKLTEQKLLKAPANDEGSLETGTRVTVEFTDPKVVKDRLLPLLKSSASYQFYALGGGKRPKKYNLKTILDVFLQFRRKIERNVLNRELADIQEKILTDEAKVAAIDNVTGVAEVLSTSAGDDEAAGALSGLLNISLWQAGTLLNTSLRSLVRSNKSTVQKRLDKSRVRADKISDDLEDIDGVVARRLREMLKYADKRGTRLRSAKQDIDENLGESTYYVGVTPQAKLESFTEIPVKSKATWGYVDLVTTSEGVVVVSEDNVGQYVPLSYIDRFDDKIGTVIGATSDNFDLMVAVSEQGKYVAFPTKQRRSKFPVFKELGDDRLVQAVGLNTTDKFTVIFDDGTEETVKEIKVTRPNVRPRPVNGKRKKKSRKVVRVIPRRSTETLVDLAQKTEIGSGRLGAYTNVATVGAQNLVVLSDGRRLSKNADATLRMLTNQPIEKIIPV